MLHTYYVLAGATPVLVHNCLEDNISKAMDGLSDHVTSAVPTDANGSVIGPEFRSGNDAAQRRANGMLQRATGRRAQWDAAAHAEPKVALWMNDNDVSFANIVINNSYVCGGAGG
ncbi:DddA-like double-stranded DNA deaminase toxin [Streptomyces sp. T028]|uniref:DddA-like double-stranded DNA deaminase toxin n=1 Tax=Streptomyces sp. T028 TaxID=3394379 RepID=UPI003A851B45